MSIVSILIAMLVFFVIVVLHELGHFVVAKLCGVKVNKFAVGMGPAIFKKQKGETEYSLRAFPIGGYCAMEGEDDDSDDPRAFHHRPVWQRMLVVFAGPVMNLILGFIFIIIMTCLYGSLANLTVAEFRVDPENGECIAMSAETGLQVGDTIIKINGMQILVDNDLSYKLSTNDSDTMDVLVRRNGQKVLLKDVTFRNKLNNTRLDFYVSQVEFTPLNVIRYSFLDTISTARLIWSSLRDLFSGKYGFHDLTGPIGIVSGVSEVISQPGVPLKDHVLNLLNLASFITVNVGIFNLLPIPALDGARLVFLVVEGIRRKPIPPEKEGMVHLAGMALLFLLMIAVSIQDILKLFNP